MPAIFSVKKTILILLLIAAFLTIVYYLYKGTETARQQKWFTPPAVQSEKIYNGQPGGSFIAPFNFDYQPMKLLALLNFENQPDSIYRHFEIQYFDDDLHGKGFLVIGYRIDRKVDVYIQTGLKITSNYDEAEGGLADKLERPMSTTRFEVTDQHTLIEFSFEDKTGRPIKVHLLEDYRTNKRSAFNILAPLGSGSQNPPAFPLYVMYDISFVREKGTELSIEIDGKKMVTDTLPIPFNGENVYIVRVSSNPVILNWNRTYAGELNIFHPEAQKTINAPGIIYTLANNNGHMEISSIRPENVKDDIRIDFYPAFPELSSLANGQRVNGNFTAWLGASTGQIDGTYLVWRNGDKEQVELRPNGGWWSGSNNLWVHLLFAFVPSFENWPKDYLWSAAIDLTNPDAPQMKSQWVKTQ